jgi:hypothetical protein
VSILVQIRRAATRGAVPFYLALRLSRTLCRLLPTFVRQLSARRLHDRMQRRCSETDCSRQQTRQLHDPLQVQIGTALPRTALQRSARNTGYRMTLDWSCSGASILHSPAGGIAASLSKGGHASRWAAGDRTASRRQAARRLCCTHAGPRPRPLASGSAHRRAGSCAASAAVANVPRT